MRHPLLPAMAEEADGLPDQYVPERGTVGSIHIAGAVADFLDTVREMLPDIPEQTKTEPPSPSVPPRQSNTTIITQKEIQTHRDQTVQEALQRVTGVTVNEQVPGISSFVKLNGDDRVLILVDGQSLANAQGSGYGRGSVDLTSLPGAASIDHIEVTKGSGSVRYGSGAVGGVINIVTKKQITTNRLFRLIPVPGACMATPHEQWQAGEYVLAGKRQHGTAPVLCLSPWHQYGSFPR